MSSSKVVVNKAGTSFASPNWLALQKKISKSSKNPASNRDGHTQGPVRKKRKLGEGSTSKLSFSQDQDFVRGSASSHIAGPSNTNTGGNSETGKDMKNGESLSALRKMIAGQLEYTESQKLPGKYLALDCEMVGVGIDGSESSLARVSLVNFHGAVILDEFVKQRERVVDYRTQWSGVRESDMIKAKPFGEIQKQVAALLKDRILIGHAIYNDLKVLLLSHPRPLVRDTQYFSGKYKVVKSKYVALKNLVKQELDVSIQEGEHSSLTDARATMAVYRLHRKEWEKSSLGAQTATLLANVVGKGKTPEPAREDEHEDEHKGKHKGKGKDRGKKRKVSADEDEDDGTEEDLEVGPPLASLSKKKSKNQKEFPGGGRKGVSSGLSTIVRQKGKTEGGNEKGKGTGGTLQKKASVKDHWWKELGNSGGATGAKFSLGL